ncbi:hypothetical protein [Streptomyces sp. NBC_01020]
MSTEHEPETSQATGLTRDDAIRAMLVLMPRVASGSSAPPFRSSSGR